MFYNYRHDGLNEKRMNRHIYHYCASSGSNQLAGIAQLTFRIMTQKDIHRFMGELEKIGFKAEAITSLSYLGEDGECAGQADYKVVVQGLMEERSKIGMDIDAAIRDGVVPDEHPLRSRLEMLANHRQREQELLQALKHLHHNAKASGAEMGLALEVAEKAISGAE